LSAGAGRGRLVRQFMTESLMLSMAGGALGMALAFWGVAALRRLGPHDLPRLSEIAVDARVLAFTLLASLVSAILFGLVPAFSASSTPLSDCLKEGGRAGDSPRHRSARGILVIVQITFSVVLLIGAGLLIRSFDLLGLVNPGFQTPPDRLLTMFVSPTGPNLSHKPAALAAYWVQLLERLRSLPGVEAASLSNALPPNRRGFSDTYQIEGKPLPPGSDYASVPILFVSYDYFRALGIPLLRGRWFDYQDTATSPRVTVISDAMARRHFPGENPLGQRLRFWGQPLEIVGVVGDVKYQGLERENEPIFYQLSSQNQSWDMWLVLRTQGGPQALAETIRREIRGLDSNVPVDRIGTMGQVLSESVALPRFRSLLMTVFATTALLLAAIGIYGVIAYSVAQRTQELGVRMALGATRSRVLTLVIGQGSRLAILGIALGLAGAFGLTRILKKMLFGITPSDTVTFVATALLLGAVAIAASLIPALRAARIDPVTLRHE
jgi:putative ABC transport system permease protein